MKQLRIFIAVLSIGSLLLATASFAQQREGPPSRSPGVTPAPPGAERPIRPQAAKPEEPPVPKASTFIGSNVVNPEGENLGKIEDLVIDPMDGRIKYVALSYGSILGLGGKLFAVSWDALELQPDGKTFTLNISQETLESSAGFEKDNWPEQPDPILSASTPGAVGGGAQAQKAQKAGPGEAVSATVQEVNAENETVTLRTEDDKTVELQAPANMLSGLQAGDVVEVKMSGTRATEIRKKE